MKSNLGVSWIDIASSVKLASRKKSDAIFLEVLPFGTTEYLPLPPPNVVINVQADKTKT